MPDVSLAFDHVHLVSQDPHSAASWYVAKLGGKIIKAGDIQGVPQIHLSLGDTMVIVRGQRDAELATERPGSHRGIDHFGLRVDGDFNGFCAGLRSKGVAFSVEPTDLNPTTRIAFIQAPDEVSVELVARKDQRIESAPK